MRFLEKQGALALIHGPLHPEGLGMLELHPRKVIAVLPSILEYSKEYSMRSPLSAHKGALWRGSAGCRA